MALSLTTAIKNKVGYRTGLSTYANLSTEYQALVDGEGASVLLELENYANWFTLASVPNNAPDVWEPWFVDEISAKVAATTHPERYAAYVQRANRSKADALATYCRITPDYNPASVTEAFVYQLLNVRKYVIAHCARLKPVLFPDPVTIDAAFDESYKFVFNKGGWSLRRRPVVIRFTRSAFTGGTYTHSTKTISGLTSVGTSLATGTRFYVTSGTNANLSDFPIASTTSTTIVLAQSLGSSANGSTDIAGFYVTVTVEGLESGESFDAIAGSEFVFTTGNPAGRSLVWATADEFAARRALDAENTGTPLRFRTHQIGSTTVWLLSPPPDADYAVRGEVLIAQPSAPTSATATANFTLLAPEFLPAIRRRTLAQVLTNHGRTNEQLTREVNDEIEALFPVYQDPGEADTRTDQPDVYGDRSELMDTYGNMGGRL